MRAAVQRVSRASVTVEGRTAATIERGLLVYLGVAADDDDGDLMHVVDKVRHLEWHCRAAMGFCGHRLTHLYRTFIRSGLCNRLAISHEGLHFKLSWGDDRTVPWEEIGFADRTWVTGTLRVRGSDGSSVFVCPIAEFSGKKMVLHSIAEINRLKEMYKPTG